MYATVSAYPRVSEWTYIGDTAINLAQVAAIEFGSGGSGAYAVVRLSSYTIEYEADGLDKTWFKVRDAATIGWLRAYVDGLRAPE